jgi:hypothetical protein
LALKVRSRIGTPAESALQQLPILPFRMQQGAFYHKVNSISFLLRHGNFFDLHIGGVAKVSIFGSQAKTLNQD